MGENRKCSYSLRIENRATDRIRVDASFHFSSKLVFHGPSTGSGGPPLWFSFVGGFSSVEELKDIVVYIPWGWTRTQLQGYRVVYWLFFPSLCIFSFSWLATVWPCPLTLREGHGVWSFIPKSKKWRIQKGLCPGAPQGLAWFHLCPSYSQ